MSHEIDIRKCQQINGSCDNYDVQYQVGESCGQLCSPWMFFQIKKIVRLIPSPMHNLTLFFFFFRMLAQSYTPNIYTPTPIPLLYNPFTITLHKRLRAYMVRAAHTPASWIGTKRNKDFHPATPQPIGNQDYWPNPYYYWPNLTLCDLLAVFTNVNKKIGRDRILELTRPSRLQFVNLLNEVLPVRESRLHQMILLAAENFRAVIMPSLKKTNIRLNFQT